MELFSPITDYRLPITTFHTHHRQFTEHNARGTPDLVWPDAKVGDLDLLFRQFAGFASKGREIEDWGQAGFQKFLDFMLVRLKVRTLGGPADPRVNDEAAGRYKKRG